MAVRTVINDSQGVVQSDVTSNAGVVVRKAAGNEGFMPYPHTAEAITANRTLAINDGGVYTLSGGNGGAVITVTMPRAAQTAGSMFVFRSISEHAHVITCSQEANGTRGFTDATGSAGSRVTFAANRSAVALIGTGGSFMIIGTSGSATVSGA